ncbi:MAG: orotidine-5'-phosphate decarboxylase [Actinomycetia bacterium]|nr:orotidine-5'-phosphate decarboxylase [Actinomycetes bacterium]
MTGTDAPSGGLDDATRARMALALDVDDLVVAMRLARGLRPYFGVAKVGLELYSAVGPDVIGALLNLGYEVFLDLKLHDIPTTVGKSSQVLGALGVSFLTLHAHGGVSMLRAGVEGLGDGARNAGLENDPMALAITVLTSDADAPPHIVPKRVRIAAEAGCGGIVCASGDLKDIREFAPRLTRVVPGIRAEGAPKHDQPRAATPQEAFDAGADILVVGRAVTTADDPPAAAAELFAGVEPK